MSRHYSVEHKHEHLPHLREARVRQHACHVGEVERSEVAALRAQGAHDELDAAQLGGRGREEDGDPTEVIDTWGGTGKLGFEREDVEFRTVPKGQREGV